VAIELPDETTVKVAVPAGTQPGEVIAVKGKGAPRVDGRGRGSLQVIVQVEVPKALSPRAIELLRELHEELARPPAEEAKTA
jgi:molecular chaperone DnaJ